MVPFLSRGHVIENSHLNFILKTLREKNKNTVGAIQKHCGSDLKTLRERESAPSVFLFFSLSVFRMKLRLRIFNHMPTR